MFFGVSADVTTSSLKMYKRMQYALNYSGTRFLSTENQNYSIGPFIREKIRRVLNKT